MGDGVNKVERAMLAGLFCLSAMGVFGQQKPSPPQPKEKNNVMNHMSFLVPLTCIHSDRLTPFREIPKLNLGLLSKYALNDNLSVIQGVYNNSNYGLTETAGMIREWKLGRLKLGIIGGIAIYPHVERDRQSVSVQYGPPPENTKKKGLKITNIDLGDGRYLEMRKEYRAHGLRNKWRILPVLVGTATYNAFANNKSWDGSGPFAIFSYVPQKSGDKNGLAITAIGAQIVPHF